MTLEMEPSSLRIGVLSDPFISGLEHIVGSAKMYHLDLAFTSLNGSKRYPPCNSRHAISFLVQQIVQKIVCWFYPAM